METNQRVIVTKRMLREGLLRLLDGKSLEKISITELCREAGVNRTTFYRYYEFPKDILLEMQSEFFEESFDHFQHPLTSADIERFFGRLSEHASLVKLFFRYNSDTDWVQIFERIYHSIPAKNVARAFHNLDENSAKLLSAYLAGGTLFLVRQWIMGDVPMTANEVAALVPKVLNQDEFF